MPSEIFKEKEYPQEVESEMEEIYELEDRRRLLMQHSSELFEEEMDIEFKYPSTDKYDENRKYLSNRSFLSPEDMERFKEIEEGNRSIKAENDEIEKEMLSRRFEGGLKHLQELLKRDDIIWRQLEHHVPDSNDTYDLYRKKWATRIGNDLAEVEFMGERKMSFFQGMQEIAKITGDVESVEALKKWPKEREIPFQEVHVSFCYGPKKKKRWDEYLRPGLWLTKRFDFYEERDYAEAHLPLSLGTAFPRVDTEKLEKAREAMIQLGKKLGIESL